MADFKTPQLIVTQEGLNAANAATPFGPWVHITSFKIGSAWGYDSQKIPQDTDIDGDLLYHGVPTQYKNLGNGVLDIILRIPADAGPFKFGEVAIFNKDDTGTEHLFAKAVFDEPQTKYSSLGTNVASSFTIHALIKLEQSVAVFKIDTLTNNAIMEVDRWSDVLLPYLSADPDTPLLLVRELDGAGCSSLLHYSVPGEEKWTIGTNYEFLKATTVKNSSAYTVRVPVADIQPTWYGSVDRQFVLEIAGRNDPYRSCVSLVKQGQDAVFTINPQPLADLPAPGTAVRIYYSVNTPVAKLATNTSPGLVVPGTGLIIEEATPGVIETHGLVHGVNNAGRILTQSDDLMSTSLPSGVYDIVDLGSGRPSGMPPGTYGAGQLYRTNTLATGTSEQSILDTFYPHYPGTGTPATPYSSQDVQAWYKEYRNGVWSPWRTLMGSEGSGGGGGGMAGRYNYVWGTPMPISGVFTSYSYTTHRSCEYYCNGVFCAYSWSEVEHGDTVAFAVHAGDRVTYGGNPFNVPWGFVRSYY